MRRIFLTVAALTIPLSVVAATFSGPAWAKTKPENSITCKELSGTVTGTVTASGCTGNTGKSSQPLSATALATGGTVTWINGKTTTIGKPTPSTVTNKKCKGTAESVSAPVTADTTGLTSLGTMTTEVCISSSEAISALKPVTIT